MNTQTQIIELLDSNKDLCFSTYEIQDYVKLSNSSINRLLRILKKWDEVNYKLIHRDSNPYYIYWSVQRKRPKYVKLHCKCCNEQTTHYKSYKGMICVRCRLLDCEEKEFSEIV